MATNPDSNNSLALADLHQSQADPPQSVAEQQRQEQVPFHIMRTAQSVALDAGILATTSWYRIAPHRLRAIFFIGLLSIVLLLVGGSIYAPLRDSLSASSASVKITPVSQTVSNQYTLTAVLGTPDSSHTQVAAHLISQSTPIKSLTVPATGEGKTDATAARGMITVRVIEGSISTDIRLTSNSGVVIIAQVIGMLTEGSTTDLEAFAQKTGPDGNIPALDINDQYSQRNDTLIEARNLAPFSGGHDARNFTSVQQSDIDNATQQLKGQFSTSDTATTQVAVHGQLASTEQLLGTIQCKPDVSSNHQSGDEAEDVTVKMAIICIATAYKGQDVMSHVSNLLERDASAQPGPAYTRTGNITTTVVSVNPFQQGDTVINFRVYAQGVWSFALNRKDIAALIAGKKCVDADALLTQQQGVKQASIETSGGLGTALPMSLEHIQVVILHAKR